MCETKSYISIFDTNKEIDNTKVETDKGKRIVAIDNRGPKNIEASMTTISNNVLKDIFGFNPLMEKTIFDSISKMIVTPERGSEKIGDNFFNYLGSNRVTKYESVKLNDEERSEYEKDKNPKFLVEALPLELISNSQMKSKKKSNETIFRKIGLEKCKIRSSKARIAILDTGIDVGHPIFASKNIISKNFTNGKSEDLNGHGTFCAGLLYGGDYNDKRIGVLSEQKECGVVAKVIGKGGDMNSLINAIKWAVDEHKSNIISLSLGFNYLNVFQRYKEKEGISEKLALRVALNKYSQNIALLDNIIEGCGLKTNCIFFAASGNDSRRDLGQEVVIPCDFPASSKNVLSIGSVNGDLKISDTSNTNVDYCAPGNSLMSAQRGDDGLLSGSGTSYSVPIAAGVAAIHFQKYINENGNPPDLDKFKGTLSNNVKKVKDFENYTDKDYGLGVIKV